MIRAIEELSINAWPALQTLVYDGWVLRFADGHTKRANSVNPLYPSSLDVQDKIGTCEQIYGSRGLNVIFKMTSAVHPEDLDAHLAARGYRVDSLTSVQTLSLGDRDDPPAPSARLAESLTDEWLSAYCRMSGVDGQRAPVLGRMLGNIIPARCFASLHDGERAIACGLAVTQDGFTGLYDIVTDREFRGRGYGQQLVLNLLVWGTRQGAHTAYLQVMLDNMPALRLYAGLGFREIYRYWYRIKS